MKEAIEKRFQELVTQARTLIDQGFSQYGQVPLARSQDYQAWLFSVLNLFRQILPDNSPYVVEATELAHSNGRIIMEDSVRKMFGLLQSAKEEWDSGLLRRIEYIIAAATFDDFLDHAATFHKGNQKIEAAVLVSAVFEDSLRKIAAKNGEGPSQKIDLIIQALKGSGVFTDTKAKRVLSYADLRTKAAHARWNEFTIEDVGETIKGVRDLIEKHL